MKIELKEIPVRDLFAGYQNDDEEGVLGYNGKLNIRPKYQREFIYNETQQASVINTVQHGFPLNTMYWIKNDEDKYELLDGQQRTLSLCSYINGDFSVDYRYFHNLNEDEKNQILDYKLMIYICEGNDTEKLEWFKTINIAGEKLTNQELRNAIYTGEWLTDAKRYFSKTNCAAYNLGKNYLKGSPIRQDYLETVLKWKSASEEMTIEEYMAEHQQDTNASDLWLYYKSIISWVQTIFFKYRKEMKGLNYGLIYDTYKDEKLDPKAIEKSITDLMQDEDVTNKSGIYEYVLDNNEKHLHIRAFPQSMRRSAYERQKGICPKCNKQFSIDEMEADHITPWSKGGHTEPANCQMLCKECNRRKSDI